MLPLELHPVAPEKPCSSSLSKQRHLVPGVELNPPSSKTAAGGPLTVGCFSSFCRVHKYVAKSYNRQREWEGKGSIGQCHFGYRIVYEHL